MASVRMAVAVALIGAACAAGERVRSATPESTDAATRAAPGFLLAAPPPVARPVEQERFVALAVPGHLPAVLSVPEGPPRSRPVLVAAGGALDTPEGQCRMWRAIVRGRGFVLCLRGVPDDPGAAPDDRRFYYPNHLLLESEALAALSSLQDTFGASVDPGPALYAGFSQGATMGALVLLRNPQKFARAILTEGGGYVWRTSTAVQYRKGGGERITFVCGQAPCFERAERSARYLEAAGVTAKTGYAEGAGHTYEGAVAIELAKAFEGITQTDPRWQNPP